MKYNSTVWKDSGTRPGVRYRVRRMSFDRRLELIRSVRDTVSRLKFLEAGGDCAEEEAEAAILAADIDRHYLEWGLVEIAGLEIDGSPATPDSLMACGPEKLLGEALGFVVGEAGLTEAERKNSESHSTSTKIDSPGGIATNVGERDLRRSVAAVGLPQQNETTTKDLSGSVGR